MEWKQKFVERYSGLTDMDKFIEASLKPLRKTIRVNTLKTTVNEMKNRFKLEQIPWCKEGFYIDGTSIGNTIEHFLGYIYLQGAASMIPALALDPKPEEKVLDMCAAPGSKTSQIAAMMKNRGVIIANDHKLDRIKPLTLNLQRCGVLNAIVTQMEGYWFEGMNFDKVLVDAPCSGVGTIRKSYKSLQMWNPNLVKQMCGIQKRLLITAAELVNPGGNVVYSTCTLEPQENEEVISWLLDKKPDMKVKKIDLPLKRGKPVEEFEGKTYNSEVRKCLRLWPQDNDTEGFFVAKLVKE